MVVADLRHHPFPREAVFPSWWANAIQQYIAGMATDLRLSRVNATTIQVAPRPPHDRAAIAIDGRWRYIDAAVQRSYPGGTGTFDVWAVTITNDVTNSPDPYTDHTDYAFDLRITATGVNPSGTGVGLYEKIGELDAVSGSITALRQTHGSIPGAMLTDGVLTNSGRVAKTRQPDGSFLLDLVDDSVTAEHLAPDLRSSLGLEEGASAYGAHAAEQDATSTLGGAVKLPELEPIVLPDAGIIEVYCQAEMRTTGGGSAIGSVIRNEQSLTAETALMLKSGAGYAFRASSPRESGSAVERVTGSWIAIPLPAGEYQLNFGLSTSGGGVTAYARNVEMWARRWMPA